MVRQELRLPPHVLPEAALRAVWRALDVDGTGFIEVREFGQFMRKGEAERGPSWHEKRLIEKAAEGAATRRESEILVGRDLRSHFLLRD